MSIARLPQGALRGEKRGAVHSFKGIPYAAAPAGALRYCSPQAAPAWQGMRDATVAGPAPIQTLAGAAAWLYDSAEPQGEDCLYLNVWTPDLRGSRPVMVWLHGGAWRTGHGAVGVTDGAALAARGGVVVVTVNYRLGALGWLAHPDLGDPETGAFANWGLQDQVAALRWVRANIAAFGGDPGNVTLFGESAGGSSTASIVQNPANAGLVHKAIIQSGSLHGAPAFPEPERAAAYAEALARRLSTSVPGLRDVPVRQLHEAELALGREPGATRRFARPPALPVLDGTVLKEWPRDAVLPAIPLLVGSNRDEGVFWFDLINPDGSTVPGLPSPADDSELVAMTADMMEVYQPEARVAPEAIVAAYREPGAGRRETMSAIHTDCVFRLRALACARRHAAAGHPTFVYEFARSLAPPARGAPHTAEIPFIFATHAEPSFADKLGREPDVARLSDFMLDSWAAFARTGVPGAAWARFSPDEANVNVLGEAGAVHCVGPARHPERLAAWQCP